MSEIPAAFRIPGKRNGFPVDFIRGSKFGRGRLRPITPAAHEPLRIVHQRINRRRPYDTSVLAQEEEIHRKRRANPLRKPAFSTAVKLLRRFRRPKGALLCTPPQFPLFTAGNALYVPRLTRS